MATSYPSSRADTRPVCKYGATCFRKNPQHFEDFQHAPLPSAGKCAGQTSKRGSEAPLPSPSPTGKGAGKKSVGRSESVTSEATRPPPAALFSRETSGGRKCKFGCGRAVNTDSRRVYNTCCRRCGTCQGSGEHEDNCAGGACKSDARSSGPSEAMALIIVDHALEMRRRAKEFETAGDLSTAQSLLADAAERLESARAQMPRTSKLAGLLDRILAVSRRSGNDIAVMGPLEADVDIELERLVADLDEAISQARQAGILATTQGKRPQPRPESSLAAMCTFGCGRISSGGFNTCCRCCALCRGGGDHGPLCTGVVATPSTALVPAGTALATISDALEPSCGSGDDGGSHGSGGDSGSKVWVYGEAPAQAALRALGLDDAWPTDLTFREIRRRYMREALLCHPDKGSAAEKDRRTVKFQEIGDAYATLEAAVAILERMRGSGDVGAETTGMASTDAGARATNTGARTGDCDLLALEAGALALEASRLNSVDQVERAATAATGAPTYSVSSGHPHPAESVMAPGGMLALESGATLSPVEMLEATRTIAGGGVALPVTSGAAAPLPARTFASNEAAGSTRISSHIDGAIGAEPSRPSTLELSSPPCDSEASTRERKQGDRDGRSATPSAVASSSPRCEAKASTGAVKDSDGDVRGTTAVEFGKADKVHIEADKVHMSCQSCEVQ